MTLEKRHAFAVFLAARAFLSSRKWAGLPYIAIRRASSSCFSITPATGGTLLLYNAAPFPSEVEAARWRALLPHSLLLAVTIASSLGSVSQNVFTPLQLTPNNRSMNNRNNRFN